MTVSDLPIAVDRAGGLPLATQIANAVRGAAADGTLRVGDRLSSTRTLATLLGVSRTVVAAAYDQLLAEGWLAGRPGAGTFVTAAPPCDVPTAPVPVRPAVPPGTAAAPVDLSGGRPCPYVLDPIAWRRAWRAAADRPPQGLPDYPGDLRYRAAVVEHLLRHRGLTVDPEALLATAGTTSGLAELAALLPRGSRVGLEEPGYQRAGQTLVDAGLRVVPLPVDADGLVVDRVPAGLAAVYCSPAHQFPMACRLAAGRRLALVRRARAEGFLVVEDDYDGELRYDIAPLPLLASLGPDVVVHLGTSSKLLSPTLGAGWLVAPPELRERLVARRESTGTRPSPAGQLVFAELVEHGDLSRQLRRLRRELMERRAMVIELCTRAGVRAVGDAAGVHLRLELPGAEAERAVVAGAAAAGVLVAGLAYYHRGRPRTHGLVLGYAAPTRPELRRAITLVADVAARHS